MIFKFRFNIKISAKFFDFNIFFSIELNIIINSLLNHLKQIYSGFRLKFVSVFFDWLFCKRLIIQMLCLFLWFCILNESDAQGVLSVLFLNYSHHRPLIWSFIIWKHCHEVLEIFSRGWATTMYNRQFENCFARYKRIVEYWLHLLTSNNDDSIVMSSLYV